VKTNFKKSFGQNFFVSSNWPQKLVESAEISPQDTVLEIGAGVGAVTQILLEKAQLIIANEVDRDLIPKLMSKFAQRKNFLMLPGDFLQIDLNSLPVKSFKVVGSLPYNISKKIISKLLTLDPKPQTVTVVVQKEVADDYVARPPKATFLNNFVQIYAQVAYLTTIPKEEFYPTPKVSGAILHFKNIYQRFPDAAPLKAFIKQGYLTPRKTLLNNLKSLNNKETLLHIFKEMQLKPSIRASELSLKDWYNLYTKMHN